MTLIVDKCTVAYHSERGRKAVVKNPWVRLFSRSSHVVPPQVILVGIDLATRSVSMETVISRVFFVFESRQFQNLQLNL